jgi:uncharacterized protein YbaP (TraB family)
VTPYSGHGFGDYIVAMIKALLITAALMALPLTAPAQETVSAPEVAQDGTEWITEVTVTANLPGPAMWRVKKGDSEVYILGAMPVMVKRIPWDDARIRRVLKQSNVLLTAPEAEVGLIGLTKLQMNKRLPMGKKLDEVLPADVSQRFYALADAYGLDRDKYKKATPLWAAAALRADIYEKAQIATLDPEKTLKRFAKEDRLKTRPTGSYSAAKIISRVGQFSKAQEMSCVRATLDEIEFSTKNARAATEAWGRGDLKTVQRLSPDSALLACLEGAPSTSAMLGRTIDQTVGSINKALETPGKSVIVLPLSALLSQGGALQKLKLQGLEITEPAL